MIWTTIVCTKCNNPTEISGRVELPFVCASCREAEEFNRATAPAALKTPGEPIREGDYVPGSAYAGTTRQASPSYDGDPGDEHEACDTATVEATTRLIADLEDQVAAYKAEVEALEEENEELEEELNEDMELLEKAVDVIDSLRGQLGAYASRGFLARLFNV